jgi:hypothetical protein
VGSCSFNPMSMLAHRFHRNRLSKKETNNCCKSFLDSSRCTQIKVFNLSHDPAHWLICWSWFNLSHGSPSPFTSYPGIFMKMWPQFKNRPWQLHANHKYYHSPSQDKNCFKLMLLPKKIIVCVFCRWLGRQSRSRLSESQAENECLFLTIILFP